MTPKSSDVVPCPSCGKGNRVPPVARGVPRCGHCHSPLPWVVEAGDATFADVAEASTVPVLVDLWAPWCGPCRMVSPALEQLAREYAGRLKLVKVNVDEAPSLALRFDARAIPTLLVMKDRDVLARQVGAAPPSALRSWLESVLPRAA